MRARSSAWSGYRCSMPSAVSRSRMPNSFSRSRSSTHRAARRVRAPPASRDRSAVCARAQIRRRRARRWAAPRPAARRTTAERARPARSPSALSGTSTSRSAMSITAQPARVRGVARDVAGTLAVPHDPEVLWPASAHSRCKGDGVRRAVSRAATGPIHGACRTGPVRLFQSGRRGGRAHLPPCAARPTFPAPPRCPTPDQCQCRDRCSCA